MLFAAILSCYLPASGADAPWLEVRSSHFRILSDASEKSAREVAREFEQIRTAFGEVLPGIRSESSVPLEIIAPHDEASTKALLPQMWKRKGFKPAGFFSGGWEKNLAVVRLDIVRGESQSQIASAGYEVIYHEYTHSLLHSKFRWLPVWFDEGFAEFFAYTRFERDKVYIGAPSGRAAYTRDKTLIALDKVLGVTRSSPEYRDEQRVQVFYSEAWGLVHFLMVAPEMERGKRLQRFLVLLEKGVDQKQAFREAIGEIDDIEKQLTLYMRRTAFGVFVLNSRAGIEESFTVRRLKPNETNVELGSFQIWLGEKQAGRLRLERASSESPDSALAHESMGFLNFVEGDDAKAAKEFDRALELDGTLYLSAYYKTMLSSIAASDTAEDREKLGHALGEVQRLNPQFAPAYVQLANLFMQDGKFEAALSLALKAEQISPSRAGYHTFSGHILHALGRDIEAASVARYVTERWREIDHNEAVELWQQLPSNARQGADLSPEPLLSGARTLTGKIGSLQCNENEKTVTITIDGDSRTFRMDDRMTGGFSDTIWFGGDHFSYCHHTEGLRAAIQYSPSSNGKSSGNLLKIDIYDNPSFRR